MSEYVETVNRDLEKSAPSLFASLSTLGRRVAFPPDIPFQAAQARDAELDATIGQITDGAGGAVRLPSMFAPFDGLDLALLDRAFLYSPVEGMGDLRQAWRGWQRREFAEDGPPSTLPLVTAGLTHGLAVIADLFTGPETTVVAHEPFWGNYRQIFSNRTGATLVTAPSSSGRAKTINWPGVSPMVTVAPGTAPRRRR